MFVIDTLGSGGKERRLTELLKALLLRHEVDAELVIMSDDIHYTEVFSFGIRIHKIIRRTRKDITVFWKLKSIIKDFKPDAVHCWESMTAIYLAPLCRMMKCPLINGMVTNVPLQRNILNHHWLRARLTFPLSEVVVSNSIAGLTAYKVPSEKGVIIYNGFDFKRIEGIRDKQVLRREMGITTPFVVGMVASFWQQKDYPTYFKAAHILLEKRKDITFMAIGYGTDLEDSVKLIRKELLANFNLLGKRPDVENLVNAMDVCVLATFTEGTSNAILEYMALGKPTVATDGGGTAEIINDGVNGFLVKPANPAMLAGRIEVLLDDDDLRRKMGDAGVRRIREAFSIDRMVNEYVDLYTRVSKRIN